MCIEKIRKTVTTHKVIKLFIFVILFLVVISVGFSLIQPLLPTAEEYDETEAGFPDRLGENFDKWLHVILPRRLLLLNEHYTFSWILLILSNIFFLLLVANIRKVLSNSKLPESKELQDHYFDWAIASLLITIVFITKEVDRNNVSQIGLGVLALSVSVVALTVFRKELQKKMAKKS